MTFLRVVTPSVFVFWPLDGGLPVWSRRADMRWLADQFAAEALAAGVAAPAGPRPSIGDGCVRATSSAGVDTRADGAGSDLTDGPGVGDEGNFHTPSEPRPVPPKETKVRCPICDRLIAQAQIEKHIRYKHLGGRR